VCALQDFPQEQEAAPETKPPPVSRERDDSIASALAGFGFKPPPPSKPPDKPDEAPDGGLPRVFSRRDDEERAAFHGPSPPDADGYEAVRVLWNTPFEGFTAPPCNTLVMNERQATIWRQVRSMYPLDKIINAVDNYQAKKARPSEYWGDATFVSLFKFLDNDGFSSFAEDSVFRETYKSHEKKP